MKLTLSYLTGVTNQYMRVLTEFFAVRNDQKAEYFHELSELMRVNDEE